MAAKDLQTARERAHLAVSIGCRLERRELVNLLDVMERHRAMLSAKQVDILMIDGLDAAFDMRAVV
jgi:hypothetical protein